LILVLKINFKEAPQYFKKKEPNVDKTFGSFFILKSNYAQKVIIKGLTQNYKWVTLKVYGLTLKENGLTLKKNRLTPKDYGSSPKDYRSSPEDYGLTLINYC
jgi:hypothetical protein